MNGGNVTVRDKLRQKDVSVTRMPSGAYYCSAVVDGHLYFHTFYGYTKREAVRLFTQAVNYDAAH